MKPSKESLLPYIHNRKEAAENFGVSDKTILRWLKGSKLDSAKACDIRKKHHKGVSIKKLAEEYKVTFSTISRVVSHITYKESVDKAKVSVVYNPH